MARGFGTGFTNGLMAGVQFGQQLRGMMDQQDLAEAMKSAGDTSTTQSASGDEALANFKANFTPQAGGPQTAEEYLAQNPDIAKAMAPEVKESAIYSMGRGDTFRQRTDQAFTPQEQQQARMQAGITTLAQQGRIDEAVQARIKNAHADELERNAADRAELRQVLAGGAAKAMGRTSDGRDSIGTGPDITGASNVLGLRETASMPAGKPAAQKQTAGAMDDATYFKDVAPRAIATLVKQGRIEEAAAVSKFIDSEQGRQYASRWLSGVRRHALGDSAGALGDFEKLYNAQLYADGNTVRLSPIDGGKRFRAEQLDAQGNVLGSKEGDTVALADAAAAALSPVAYAKFMVEQQAARAKEAGILDRQTSLEELRQTGQEAREDRRDERLAMRLAATAERGGRGNLTPAQERSNAEIDAAREAVAGLSPADIRRRTAKTTDTGRENPDFDPALARAAALANRKKIGDDPVFDQRQRQPAPAATADRNDIVRKFRSDPTMARYTLGRMTPKGAEVLENGKLVGHYN